jgi:hypothetical protein
MDLKQPACANCYGRGMTEKKRWRAPGLFLCYGWKSGLISGLKPGWKPGWTSEKNVIPPVSGC